GLDEMLRLVREEWNALPNKSYQFDLNALPAPKISDYVPEQPAVIVNEKKYQQWFDTNVIKQKQPGYYGVYVKVPIGNLSSKLARKFVDVVDRYASDELRVTIN